MDLLDGLRVSQLACVSVVSQHAVAIRRFMCLAEGITYRYSQHARGMCLWAAVRHLMDPESGSPDVSLGLKHLPRAHYVCLGMCTLKGYTFDSAHLHGCHVCSDLSHTCSPCLSLVLVTRAHSATRTCKALCNCEHTHVQPWPSPPQCTLP